MTDVSPIPKRKTTRRRAQSVTALRNKATRLWGEYVHLRDKRCQVCGRADGKLDAHHVMVRQFNATRADPENGVLVCFRDHQMLHSDPMRAVEFYTSRYGADGYEALRQKAYDGVSGKFGVDFWREQIAELEGLLERVR